MSRLAKKSIKISEGVTVKNEGGFLAFKGPLGERKLPAMPGVKVEVGANEIKIESSGGDGKFVGTMWSLVKNAIEGVKSGFLKTLEMEGVGYRAALEGKELVLSLGYVNPVRFEVPPGVTVKVEKNTIIISGFDKDLVGRTAADIRALKKPEPYKGKGIHYKGEVIRRKAGKKAGAAAGGSPA